MTRQLNPRAERIVAAVAAGTHPLQFGGCQMLFDKSIVSLRVGDRFRLLFKRTAKGFALAGFYTHEEYNGLMKRRRDQIKVQT